MKNKSLEPHIHILLVDPNAHQQPALHMALRTSYRVTVAETKEAALHSLCNDLPTMIIIDAEEKNMEYLNLINEHDQQTPLLLVGQHPSNEYAGDGFRRSALKMWIEQTINSRKIQSELADLQKSKPEELLFGNFITCSKYFIPIFHTLRRVSTTDVPILITGESGTGKELIAQGIHAHSNREKHPFVALNCAAIPEHLLETELFGYEKGAFTGATATKIGKLEYAGDGTVFLDEIGDMPLITQAKLLRAIQERTIERVGGHKPLPIKARIIAATNKNLPHEIQSRNFREDLYYRLNTVHIDLLPLRSRAEDIPLLAEHFFSVFSQRYNKPFQGISPSVLEALQKYSWPGNVRELVNIVHHAILLSDTPRIELRDLPPEFKLDTGLSATLDQLGLLPLDDIVEQARNKVERQLIIKALEKCKYNKAQSALYLKIDRKTLYRKMRVLGIDLDKP